MLLKSFLLTTLIFLSCSIHAKTYYIDFKQGNDKNNGLTKERPWKLCPGMSGFTGGYTHNAGDCFVFKGGSTWPSLALPLIIKNNGTNGKTDNFTTDHTWYIGQTWSQPIFTGNRVGIQLITANNKSYFKINDIKLLDAGKAGIENGNKAIDICAGSNYAITNCTIAPNSWLGLYLHSFSGNTEENILIDHNDISCAGQAIVLAAEAANTVLKHVTISNNAIHDLSSQIVGQTHGDGIHTWNSVQNDHTQFIRDLSIVNNRFYGDFSCGDKGTASMTSLIYLTDPGTRAIISGNELSYSATTHFASLIWVRYFDSVAIVNNTLVLDPKQGGIGIIVGQGDPGKQVIAKNNIITGAQYCYYLYEDACKTTVIDNNDCVTTGQTVAFWNMVGKTWEEWQKLGYDAQGMQIDPQFVSATDFRLQESSPCIGKADNMGLASFMQGILVDGKRSIGAHETIARK